MVDVVVTVVGIVCVLHAVELQHALLTPFTLELTQAMAGKHPLFIVCAPVAFVTIPT